MSIDQYIIKEKLKEKGQYISYRAIESESNSGVILKKFISSYPTAQAIGKLRSEFAILNKFDHPGIINAISLEPSDNSLMLVLEELEGEMLHDYISEKVELAEFFKISIAIVEAIKILHSKKILHKNINSYTINVSPEKVTLSGFDYAEKQGREYQYSNVKEAFEIGLSYISPEQTGRMNRTIDHRSDLYSLGIVLYELITNRLPFISTDPIELIHCHIAVPPIAPYEVDDSIPPIISDIIIKLLSKDTGDRYQSTRGLLHDLKRCQEFYRNNNELESFTLGEKDISDQFYIPGKLYGRSSELEQLTQSYLRAKEGRAEASFVAGYSGIGKSRLVRELQKLIDQDKGFFIKGKFDQFKQNGPLSSLFSAFSNLIDQLLSESEEKIEMWQNKVTAALGNTGQIIIDAVPEVELLIGPQPSLPELPIAEAENRYNQAINNFVKVFTDKEHPLCIFLDDMQWIDPATRQWIETQLSDTNLNHFYFIGAFRDNEVSPSHPLILMIDRIEKLDLSVDKIFLDPLEQKNIEQLLGDTLYVKPEHCSDLARELYKKTNGNPFFIRQAMLSLYEKKAIYFSQEHQKWTYDLEKVSKAKISDNVIELLTDLLHRLPIEILNTLKNASCIGSKFDIHVLSHISGYTKEQINIHLEDADKEGLLVPILSRGIDYPQDYAFQHDKIQQAALSLLSSAEKQNIQLKIGRFLLQESEDLSADDKIYEIANHFNAALDLITEEEEFKKIVEVNLLASKRAKNATAYDSALNYIVQAMNLVPQNTWEHPSDLTKELFLQRAESEHLSGNDENAPYFFDKAIDHANSVLDKAEMSIRKIHYYNNVRNFKEAYNTGRLAAKPLGVNLPSNFFPPKLIADFAQYKFLKGRRKIDDIINLGQMSDEKLKMAILIMSTVARSAYQIRPELCVAVSAKMVNICLKHGNTDGGFIGFVAFGPIFHGAILNQKDSGFEFGKLTLDLVEKYKSHLFKAETHFVVGYFAMPWKRPVKEMEDYWKIAYEAGLEVGDFFHSSCACCGTIQSYFMRGMNYDEVLSASDSYLDFLKRIDNQEAILTIQAVRQSILNLKGRTESAVSYNDEIFNEEEYKESLSAFGSRHFAHYYYINKMQTLYLWGEYEKAYEISLISDKYLKDSPGMLHTAEHYFYKGLILASLLARQGRSKNRKWIASLTKIHKKFKTYAQGCENNFLHKSRLLEAELMNIKGKEVKAQSLYYSSIDAATKYGYLQIQALANELLARFNTNAGRSRLARFHLKDAEYCYNMLGAEAYAKYLTRRYSEEYSLSSNAAIGNQISENLSSNASNKTHIPDIDLSTILKSSAAISREIRLQDLLPTLMKIIIENAGAQRMVLLLKQGKELIVQAESIANTNEVKILSEVPLNKYSKLAKSIVNYVYNAKEPVILEDAAITGNFTNDEYVRTKKPRSILCAPLVKQGNITGIIYLENNLSHAAFTPERIDMLLLLSGQMAISIDNALLYDNLEDKVKERTLELEKEKDKSDSLLLNILPADIAQELKTTGKSKANHFKQVTVMFTDFQNFTQTSESLSAYELVEEINYYYSAFDNIITKHGIEKIKTIGDSYMCAGGLPEVKESNPYDTVMAALEINDFLIKESKNPKGKKLTKMRIGLHTGPVIAGIVGIKKFAYDIWGDTVNIASRMESRGEPGKINISETTYEAIKDRFNCTYRGKIEIKHKAPINMYFVDGMK